MRKVSDLGLRRVLRYDMACGLAHGRGSNNKLLSGPRRHMTPIDKQCRRLLGWGDRMPPERILDRCIGWAMDLCGEQNTGLLGDSEWGPRLLSDGINAVQGVITGASETGHESRYAARGILEFAPRASTREQRLVLLTAFMAELCSPLHWREYAKDGFYRRNGFSRGGLSPGQETEETEQLIKSCVVALCSYTPGNPPEDTTGRRLRAIRRRAREMFVRIPGTTNFVDPRRVQTALEIADELERIFTLEKSATEIMGGIRRADKEIGKLHARTGATA